MHMQLIMSVASERLVEVIALRIQRLLQSHTQGQTLSATPQNQITPTRLLMQSPLSHSKQQQNNEVLTHMHDCAGDYFLQVITIWMIFKLFISEYYVEY